MKEDLDRKEGAVPPGIEIPGIPARKLVKTARPLPAPPAGLEPAVSAFGGRRPIHWATGA